MILRDRAAKWFVRAIAARPQEEHVWNDIATLFAESMETGKSKVELSQGVVK